MTGGVLHRAPSIRLLRIIADVRDDDRIWELA